MHKARSVVMALITLVIVSIANIVYGNCPFVIKLLGNQYIDFYCDGRQYLRLAYSELVEKGAYKSLYINFASGVLDLDDDRKLALPQWHSAVAKDLFASELTFQGKMAAYLFDRGVDPAKSRVFQGVLESIAAHRRAAQFRSNRTKEQFEQLKGNRLALIRLRSRLP